MSVKFSNEQIIAGLLSTGTIRDTAKMLDCSERLIYDRMHDDEFIVEYESAKTEILREAVAMFNGNLKEAIKTVSSIMQDKNCKPAVRLQASQIIIKNAVEFADRLRDDDTRNNGQIDHFNMFGML